MTAKIETVQRLLVEKFGVTKRTLPLMLRSTGRRLPRSMRKRARFLVDAAKRAGHPKLARQMDWTSVDRAYDELLAHLKAIDVADRRKGVALGVAGNLVFNLLLVAVTFIVWMWWRGYV